MWGKLWIWLHLSDYWTLLFTVIHFLYHVVTLYLHLFVFLCFLNAFFVFVFFLFFSCHSLFSLSHSYFVEFSSILFLSIFHKHFHTISDIFIHLLLNFFLLTYQLLSFSLSLSSSLPNFSFLIIGSEKCSTKECLLHMFLLLSFVFVSSFIWFASWLIIMLMSL